MGATTDGVEISAREYWNKTGIVLTRGKRYSFVAEGEWRDASHHGMPITSAKRKICSTTASGCSSCR
jgi:hypothetical protein